LQEAVVEAKAFGELVGQSSGLRNVVSQVDVVAPTEASVLILGETGTGQGIEVRQAPADEGCGHTTPELRLAGQCAGIAQRGRMDFLPG